MHSAASAIAWEFRRRHRWGLIALAAYLVVLAMIKLVIFAPGQRIDLDDESFALAVVVPLCATFMYFLAVFSFGLSGDLAARQSMYPARMFTLPVTSGALAGWPMLYGTAIMSLLWMATRFLAVWPSKSRFEVPMLWPALLGASLMAWTQALTWMAYPLRGLRVAITVLWLITIDAVVMVALELNASESVMLAILAPHVPLAYLTARFAIGRARRGDVPDWRGVFAPFGWIVNALPRRRDHFSSAAGAQAWFEWRQYGRSLPAIVAILLPCELALLFLFRETPVIVFETLVDVLLTPVFMAAFVASTVSKTNPEGSDSYGLTPFIAIRPLTSASLIATKMKVTIGSTFAAWLLVLLTVPLALRLSGTLPMVIEWIRQLVEALGMPRAIVLLLLAFAALLLSTWRQLVQSLYIGVSGREWVVKTSVFVTLSFLAIVVPLIHWVISERVAMAVLWNALPWIVAVLVCFKVCAAAWVAMRLHESLLLSDRMLLVGAASWDIAVFALYGLLVWLLPSLLFPSYFLALVAILAIPLARLSAAPLALAWNRHR